MLFELEGRVGQVEGRLCQLLAQLEAREVAISVLEVDLAAECSKSARLDAELAEKEAEKSGLVSELALKDAMISEQGLLMQRNLTDYADQVIGWFHVLYIIQNVLY